MYIALAKRPTLPRNAKCHQLITLQASSNCPFGFTAENDFNHTVNNIIQWSDWWLHYMDTAFRQLCFFLCFGWARALNLGSAIQKKHVFFLSIARIGLLPIFEKNRLISGDKNNSEKKKFITGDKKTFFQLCFFSCFFRRPRQFFFQMDQKFFILSFSLTFLEICPMFFFISSPSITSPKKGSMFFFLKCFFFTSLPH